MPLPKFLGVAIVSLWAILFSAQLAEACFFVTPPVQNIIHFFDRSSYGSIGLHVGHNHVRIISRNDCYDVSRIRRGFYEFYFNNKRDYISGHPDTYVGIIVARRYRHSVDSGDAGLLYFFRNATGEDSQSLWGKKRNTAEGLVPYGLIDGEFVNTLDESYAPEESANFDNLAQLQKKLSDTEVPLIADWHAYLLREVETGRFRILSDTLAAMRRWNLQAEALPVSDASRYRVRAYLIKYQDSGNPRRQVYFDLGVSATECIYIKLVSPGTRGPFLDAGSDPTRDFVTLRREANVEC